MKKQFFALMAAMVIFAASACAEGGAQIMRKAAAAYEQGDLERALTLWEGLYAKGYGSATLFYNLGNAYYEQGELGKAVLFYERTLLVQPHFERARHNLSQACKQVEGDPIGWPVSWPAQFWDRLRGRLPANIWALLGLVFAWTALGGKWAGLPRRIGVPVFAPMAILVWLLAWSASRALHSPYSIVQQKELIVQVGPDLQSGRAATVYEGWKLLRLDHIGDWVKVELPNGEEGWVSKETIINL